MPVRRFDYDRPAVICDIVASPHRVFCAFVSPSVVIVVLVLALAIYIAHYTRFGRAVYAVGGNEQSALLMGLAVGRTKVMVYAFSGFCAALAGVLFSFYMLSGYALHAQGTELDAIAAVMIGGTLLTGGYGYVPGTLTGVLILGLIQALIAFDGTLSSWWTKIVIGVLLFAFFFAWRSVCCPWGRSAAYRRRLQRQRLDQPASVGERDA